MLTKHRRASGFTLVELAIVLIVIGLLLGMVFKGKDLIEAAMIKAEIAKIQKVQSAFHIYVAKFDKLPGLGPGGIPESNSKIYADLIHEGLLTENDFRSNMKQSKGMYWAFNGCEEQASGTDSSWRILPTFNLEKICMFLTFDHPKDIGPGIDFPMKTDGQTVCLLETLFDNRNIYTGDGKKTVTDVEKWKQGGVFDNTLQLPCSDLTSYSGIGYWYVYRVY